MVFSIPVTPGQVKVFLNGDLLAGGGTDYTLSGATLTFITPPQVGDTLIVWVYIVGG
jgi:hypothetical protein